MKHRLTLSALGAAISLFAQQRLPNTRPSSQEQERILNEVRTYAADYTKSLPDFICTQVTRRYLGDTKRGNWDRPEVVMIRLSFFGQQEEYKVLSVNGRPSTLTMDQLNGTTSRGEFGTQLKALFAAECHASFAWKRWASLRGRRMHVFSYRVPQAYSKWHVKFENKWDVVAGYSGLCYVESVTGMVMRITSGAEDLPRTLPVRQATGELDYDFVTISDREYLLPLRSLTRLRADKYNSKNEVEYREYRKFGSESKISFDTPEPLPKEKTEERPIK